ncbi:MAG: hypothetical protein ACREBE_22845 [bacterium]
MGTGLTLALLAGSGMAQAQEATGSREETQITVGGRPHASGGLYFGGPLGASASGELLYGFRADVREDDGRVRAFAGLALSAQAGSGGGKLGLGLAGRARVEEEDFHGGVGAGLTVSVARTWGSPIGTEEGLTYLGPELELDAMHVALGLGVLFRVGGHGGAGTLFSWGLGFRF